MNKMLIRDLLDLANQIQHRNNNFTNLATERDIIEVVLKEYQRICNEKDFDYEFHYIDDVLNNEGTAGELINFFKKNSMK